jgi:hypothetical protein
MQCAVKCSLKFMCHPFTVNITGWCVLLLSPVVLGVSVSLGKVQKSDNTPPVWYGNPCIMLGLPDGV